MPLVYKNQARLEALSRKITGVPGTPRFSDLETPLFTSHDGVTTLKRKSQELAYYNHLNTDAATVNRKLSDAGDTYWEANGAAGEVRADQAEHVFYANGTFT